MQRELTKVVSLSGEPEGQAPPLATQRAAEGDAHALSQIYAQQHQSLRNFARRLLGDPHAAEDLVHDVFVGLPSALARYRGDCSLTTFLRAIAVRQAKTHLRAAVRRRAAMNRLAEELERASESPAQLPPPAPRSRKVATRAHDGIREQAPARELSIPAPVALTPDALYSEAHQLHFVAGDKFAALRAWDAYLAAAPDGTFAPEAHYNRAVCLVALGRSDAALTALRAIAAGERMSYRSRDAARLVRALEERYR